MADLGTIVGASPLNADDTTYHTFTQDINDTASYALGDMPSDFGSMDSPCNFTTISRLQNSPPGTGADIYLLGIRIMNGATVLAAGSSSGAYQNVGVVTGTSEQTNGPTAFSYVNTTASKTDWDGATVDIQQLFQQSKGPDGNAIQVDYAALTGTYTVGGSAEDASAVLFGINF